jgi:hypothetical protein
MPEGSASGRRYSDREMALILKVASQIEARAPGGEGYSLAEIQTIAAEAGIDPALVLQAAATLEAERSSRSAAILGAPTLYRFQRSVAGEVPEGKLGDLVSTIRQVIGREGEVAEVLGSLEWWDGRSADETTHVQITPQQGRTAIRVTGRYGEAAAIPYLVAGIGAAIASVVVGTELHAAVLVELGAIAALWGAAYLGGRSVWRRLADAARRRLHGLADALAAQAAASLSPDRLPPAERAPGDRSAPSGM